MCTICVNQKVHEQCKKSWSNLIEATKRALSLSKDSQLVERLKENLEVFTGMMDDCVPFPGMWSVPTKRSRRQRITKAPHKCITTPY